MKSIYFPESHTPEEWRKMSISSSRSADESFDRCDTDGFLSQWASGQMSRLYEAIAELAEAGGEWELPVLTDLEGNEIPNSKIVRTRFGTKWLVTDEKDNAVVWLPFRPAKKSTLGNKGYAETTAIKQAVVRTYDAGYNIGIEYVARTSKRTEKI